MIAGGVWAISFTYENVARERIVTPEDSRIPGIPVAGPVSLKVQADVIREHTLKMTSGKTYAEMDRNDKSRDLWITATTLTTALNVGILAYVLSGLVVLFGLASIWSGVVFWNLAKSCK